MKIKLLLFHQCLKVAHMVSALTKIDNILSFTLKNDAPQIIIRAY